MFLTSIDATMGPTKLTICAISHYYNNYNEKMKKKKKKEEYSLDWAV